MDNKKYIEIQELILPRQKFDEFGNRIEFVHNEEKTMIEKIKQKHKIKLSEIKKSDKCFGDKVRDVIKSGITNNTIYARKLLE